MPRRTFSVARAILEKDPLENLCLKEVSQNIFFFISQLPFLKEVSQKSLVLELSMSVFEQSLPEKLCF